MISSTLLLRLGTLGGAIALLLVLLPFGRSTPSLAQGTPTLEAPPLEAPLKDDDDDDDNDDDDNDDDDNDDDDDDGNGRPSGSGSRTITVTQVTYTDVSETFWAYTFVRRLSRRSIVSGFPGSDFRPNAPITRAQYAALVSRAFELPPMRPRPAIGNLPPSFWAYSAIQQAYAVGFVNLGPGNSFDPNGTITRLDLLTSLARGLGYTTVRSGRTVEEILSVYSDAATIPTEFREIIAALTERGLIVNHPNVSTLNLFQVVNRAETCAIVYQVMAYQGRVDRVSSPYLVIRETVIDDSGQAIPVNFDDNDDDDDGDDDDDDRRQR